MGSLCVWHMPYQGGDRTGTQQQIGQRQGIRVAFREGTELLCSTPAKKVGSYCSMLWCTATFSKVPTSRDLPSIENNGLCSLALTVFPKASLVNQAGTVGMWLWKPGRPFYCGAEPCITISSCSTTEAICSGGKFLGN